VTGRSLVRILSSDLTIDLGTANTLAYVTGKNIVVDELCIVALNKKTGTSMVPEDWRAQL
jgi:rod shape-determining protein MreB